MKALRDQIDADFKNMINFGNEAGYIPPPRSIKDQVRPSRLPLGYWHGFCGSRTDAKAYAKREDASFDDIVFAGITNTSMLRRTNRLHIYAPTRMFVRICTQHVDNVRTYNPDAHKRSHVEA